MNLGGEIPGKHLLGTSLFSSSSNEVKRLLVWSVQQLRLEVDLRQKGKRDDALPQALALHLTPSSAAARPSAASFRGPAATMANLPAAAITRQIGSRDRAQLSAQEAGELRDAARRLVVDGDGRRIPFGALFRDHRAIVVFVRHFLCYTCKEYVEDLAKIPKNLLQEAKVRLIVIGQSSHHHIKPFCSLTGYPHEIYVDPEREIYKILGMKKGEAATTSVQSPHVKSNLLSGSIRSMWRAMTGPAFDFQGDPAQQGGTLILGPGSKVHFVHLDKNRLDHAPISTVLLLAGVKMVNFTNKHQIIDI